MALRLARLRGALTEAEAVRDGIRTDTERLVADIDHADQVGEHDKATRLTGELADLARQHETADARVTTLARRVQDASAELQAEEWTARLALEESQASVAETYAADCANKISAMRAEAIELSRVGRNAEAAHLMHVGEIARLRTQLDGRQSGYVSLPSIPKPMTDWVRRTPGAIEFTETRF